MSDKTFHQELTELLNTRSAENVSNTPDFILAEYMMDCLNAFDKASNAREGWYGKALMISGVKDLPAPDPIGEHQVCGLESPHRLGSSFGGKPCPAHRRAVAEPSEEITGAPV